MTEKAFNEVSRQKIEIKENPHRKLRKIDEDIIVGDNSKLKKDLGWDVTIPIEDTLKDMYNYWLNLYTKKDNK